MSKRWIAARVGVAGVLAMTAVAAVQQPAGADAAAPAEASSPVESLPRVDIESVAGWSELDDRQLTRLLKSAAP